MANGMSKYGGICPPRFVWAIWKEINWTTRQENGGKHSGKKEKDSNKWKCEHHAGKGEGR